MSQNAKIKKDKKIAKNNSPHKESMNLYVVDTIVTFRHRYVVEAKSLAHAYDEVTMKDSGNEADEFEEVTQRFIGESIIDGRGITKKEFNLMLKHLEDDKDEFCSYWMGDKLIRKINYNKE